MKTKKPRKELQKPTNQNPEYREMRGQVQLLEKMGLHVYFKHQRNLNEEGEPDIFGGFSEAFIKGNDRILAAGHTTCNPKEHFDRRLGCTYSFQRALKMLVDYTWRDTRPFDYHPKTDEIDVAITKLKKSVLALKNL